MRIIEADIDMTPGGAYPTLHMNQGDSDFGIRLHLYSSEGTFTIDSGTTARVHGMKPGKTAFDSSALITGMDVVLAGTAALTDEAGVGVFEVQLAKGGAMLHSQNFLIKFERRAG